MSGSRYLVALAVVACGDPGQLGRSVVSPSDVTTRVALSDVPVTGSDVTVERFEAATVKGELLTATDKDMVVLVDNALIRIGIDEVRRVALKRYDNNLPLAVLVTWSVAGALGGFSHGVLSVIGESIWSAVSAGAIVPVAADEGRFTYTDRRSDFTFLHEYARFPQGLPPQFAARVHAARSASE